MYILRSCFFNEAHQLSFELRCVLYTSRSIIWLKASQQILRLPVNFRLKLFSHVNVGAARHTLTPWFSVTRFTDKTWIFFNIGIIFVAVHALFSIFGASSLCLGVRCFNVIWSSYKSSSCFSHYLPTSLAIDLLETYMYAPLLKAGAVHFARWAAIFLAAAPPHFRHVL